MAEGMPCAFPDHKKGPGSAGLPFSGTHLEPSAMPPGGAGRTPDGGPRHVASKHPALLASQPESLPSWGSRDRHPAAHAPVPVHKHRKWLLLASRPWGTYPVWSLEPLSLAGEQKCGHSEVRKCSAPQDPQEVAGLRGRLCGSLSQPQQALVNVSERPSSLGGKGTSGHHRA